MQRQRQSRASRFSCEEMRGGHATPPPAPRQREVLRAAFRAARLPGRRVEPPPHPSHAPARERARGRARKSFPGRPLQTSRWRLSIVDRRPDLQYQVSACPLTGMKSKSFLDLEIAFNPSDSRSKRISRLHHSALSTQHYLKRTDTAGLPGNPSYRTVTVVPAFGVIGAVNDPRLSRSPAFNLTPPRARSSCSHITALSG